jgi:rfaE bifunctional protein nucleotidyltransferase chain/domain
MGRIVDFRELGTLVDQAREDGQSIVLTNGAFDLLHVGHVRYLQGAGEHGDRVLAAVNSDSSVKALKGPERPMIPEGERAEMVAALGVVDWVVIFSELTVERVIEAVKPNVHAKGTDYTAETIPERALVESFGGRVEIVGDPKDHSTTELVEKLGESQQ